MRTWTRILLASVLVTLAVAGCSHKNKTTKPDLSHSPSPSASAAPKLPAAASARTRDGAIAFARYWWGPLAAYSYANLDTGRLHATSDAKCSACQAMVNSIETVKNKGDRFTGGDLTILDAQAPPAGSDQQQTVDVTYSVTAQQHVDKQDKVVDQFPAATNALAEITLNWANGHWVVTDIKSPSS